MKYHQRKRTFFPFIVLLLLSLPTSAQVSPEDLNNKKAVEREQQRLRTIEDAQIQRRRLAAPSVKLEKKVVPSSTRLILPEETQCHPIQAIQLNVSDKVPASVQKQSGFTLPQDTFYFIKEQLRDIEGQCVGQRGMAALIDKLTLSLIGKGYTTTRLGIEPDQNLSSGILKLTLLPGYLRAFRFADNVKVNTRTAFPIRPGEVVNLRKLEQGLEQIQRLGSLQVAMELLPGDLPGETDVGITVKRVKPWRLAFTFDDTGSDATGKLQAGASLSLDNPLGLNDVLNVGVSHDAKFDSGNLGTEGQNIYYSVPWGNWIFTTTGSNNESHQRLPDQFGTRTVSYSYNKSFDAKLSYMFMRDQVQKNNLEFRVGKRFSKNRLNVEPGGSYELGGQYRNTTFAEWSWVHRHYFGAAKFDLVASYRWGVPWLGASDDMALAAQFAGNIEQVNKILHYNYETIDATFSMPVPLFGVVGSYSLNLRGQFTQTPQDGANMFSIGNRYSVRGFDGNQTLSAEQGYYVRNEIQVPLGKTAHAVYLGLDAGRVFGPATVWSGLDTQVLAGAVLGLRGSLFRGSSYEGFVGTPLYKPKGLGAKSGLVAGFTLRQEF